MANIDKLYSGQGCVFSADRDSLGNIGAYRNVGNVSALQISLESDIAEHKETCSGSRLVDKRIVTEIRARVNMTLDSFTRDNLVYMLAGTARSLGTGAQDTLPTGTSPASELLINYVNSGVTGAIGNPQPGDVFFTKNMNISSLVVKDSAGSPVTLVAGTNYTADLVTGQITFLTGSFTGPLRATYSKPTTANESVTIFTAPITKERALLFRGLNTADANKAVRVELYKVIFDPVQNFDLINDEFGTFELEGSVLLDSYRQGDADLGGFGRVMSDSTL